MIVLISFVGDFAMTSVHKDLCEFMVTSAEDPNISDQEIIKVRFSVLIISNNNEGNYIENKRIVI